jgi:glutamate-ammonia-ligase adenylyltransferase
MDRLPPAERLDAHSIDLCRRATDIDLVLHGFKNSAHLMVGVRDILGKESVETIHRSLSDTAEACVRRVIEFEQEQLASRFGDPVTADGEPAEFLAVALGKFGGREPNYHSDLDVVFLYTADGETKRRVGGPRKTISNAQFFNQLAAAVTQRVNHAGEFGPLYELDGRLRPTGEEGVLAESQEQFLNRFRRGLAPLWQWLALCKARVISGSRLTRRAVQASLLETLRRSQWRPAMAKEIRDMRMRIQQTAADENLKRGVGGTVDVELIAQILMLRHVGEKPELFLTGTIDSLKRLRDAGLLGQQDADRLIDNYRMLRGIEANLRLMDLPARHELPEQASDLRDLAFLMRLDDVDEIASRVAAARESNRALFESILGKLQTPD